MKCTVIFQQNENYLSAVSSLFSNQNFCFASVVLFNGFPHRFSFASVSKISRRLNEQLCHSCRLFSARFVQLIAWNLEKSSVVRIRTEKCELFFYRIISIARRTCRNEFMFDIILHASNRKRKCRQPNFIHVFHFYFFSCLCTVWVSKIF